MKILFVVFLMTSCAVKMKDSKQNTQIVNVKDLAFSKPDNWADKFYQKTVFRLKNPKVVDNYKQLEKICKGPEFDFVTGYQAQQEEPIRFKKNPVSVTTSAGFSKKVYVSKGVCRELQLFKAPKTSRDGQIRINIEQMNLIYIYNFGTYLEDLTFRTSYKDVKFYVK